MLISEDNFYLIVYIWIGVAFIVFPFALLITPPYGRHTKKVGPMIPNKLGWIIMEIPSPALCLYFFLTGTGDKGFFNWFFVIIYLAHYVNRTFIWPLRTKTSGKQMPLVIVFSAIFFNLMNGPINGYYMGNFAVYPEGAFYNFHLDVFQHTKARKLSIVCYLNFDWVAEDGGQLRLYLPQEDGPEQHIDILPVAGRLVCFNSQTLEHEVLPGRRRRFSITGWLKDDLPLFAPSLSGGS